MSELRDRLERLAARGSQRGADDVLNAAMRGAPPNEVEVVPDTGGTDLPIIDDDVPFVTSEHESHPRGRFGTLVAAFGVAALVGVSALAIASVFGNGGAGSPEGAVRQLADAVSHKDALAAVDVLAPTEVRSMRQTVNEATHRAADLKIVNDASAPLAGVDLSVDHLQLSTEPLAAGYTKVIVTSGELSASTHAAAMSKLLQDAIGHSGSGSSNAKVELARLAADSNLPTFVVTVRHDGRWYVSPAYTALEYAREINGGPAAEFGSAKAATDLGADTPENAVSDAFHAWQAGNWDRLMALAPPDELPVYDYRKWIDQQAADTHPDFTIDKLSTSSTVSGDSATVKLDASGTMGSGQDQRKWQVGGTCPSPMAGWYGYAPMTGSSSAGLAESGGSGSVVNTSSPTELCLAGDLGNVVPFGLSLFGSGDVTPSSGSISIEVVRENGRWFVSPVTTVLKALDATIEHVDQRSVYTLLGLAYQLPPDGNITLDQPFTVPAGRGFANASVFAFDGTKGQKVVGEISSRNSYASGEIYTANGKDVDYVDFSTANNGYAYPATLPTTGSYRIVVTGSVPKGGTLTLWDAKHAPKGLITSDGGFGGGSCVSKPSGTSCSSSGSTSLPLMRPDPSGGGGVSACTLANNKLTCGGAAMQVCPAGSASNANADCISASTAQALTGSDSPVSSQTGTGAPSRSVTATTSAVTRGTTRVATSVP